MTNHPFFITWSKQKDALTFNVKYTKDSFYIDETGRKIIDLCSTSYQAAFGHSHSPIKRAIQKQLNSLPIATPKAIFELKEKATNSLLEILNLKGKVFYTISGAESVENALKIARQTSGKNIILARKTSYHGATLGALSLTGDWRNKDHKTVDNWTKRIPEPEEDPYGEKLEELIIKVGPEKIAGICIETITGGNGVIIPPASWWKAIKKIKKKYKILLILDEVICGFGRTGKYFGFQNFNLKPDLICLAKVITGGYIPFGAVWVSPNLSKFYNKNTLSCGLTNYAHPLGLSAMVAVIEELKSQSHIDSFSKLEDILKDFKLKSSSNSAIKECRQIGLLMAIELHSPIETSVFLNESILLSSVGNNLIIAPAFTMKKSHLKSALNSVLKIIEAQSKD
jgi:taurine--2-oxoglutarate transaminase